MLGWEAEERRDGPRRLVVEVVDVVYSWWLWMYEGRSSLNSMKKKKRKETSGKNIKRG